MKKSNTLYSVNNSEIHTFGIVFLVNAFNYQLKRFSSKMIAFADSMGGEGLTGQHH